MFSIISISRDRPESLANHLLSIINQKELSPDAADTWEWIILDDSTEDDDRQEQIIKGICQGEMPFVNVQAFRALNRYSWGGEGKTINFGIKQSNGDPIIVLCGDDVYPQGHFSKLCTIWKRKRFAGQKNFCLSWVVYNLITDCKIDMKEVSDLDILLTTGAKIFAMRRDIHPTWGAGIYVLTNLADDRTLYPRGFLFDIKGWPEWAGSWYRDEWMRRILRNLDMSTDILWDIWSFHQGHENVLCRGNAEAEAQLNLKGDWVKVSNTNYWGDQKVREIELNVQYRSLWGK